MIPFLILFLCLLLIVWLIIENKIILSLRRENFGGKLKIMHISDIHKDKKGRNNCKISDAAANNHPDLIFITGDFVSRTETDFTSAEILLNNLCEIAPVYMVYGNHEQSLCDDSAEKFINMLSRTKVNLLINDKKSITLKNRTLWICGVQQKYTTYKKNDNYRNLDVFTSDDMTSVMGECPDGEVLMLAHNPLWGNVYSEWGADYAFSGHVHGGAVRLFGIGILSPERKFFPKYSKGVYNIGSMKLCVSGGIGKLRLFNPPEIVFYEL